MKPQNLLPRLFVSALLLIIGSAVVHAATLTQWAITATTGITNSGVSNLFSGFTATEWISGPNLYAGSPTSPSGTWNRTYTNSPNPIPATGLQALSQGNYFAFDTVISAGWNINVDGVSNLILGKTASAATNAALYYSIDSGTTWLQAGGTATLPLSTGTNDYSSFVNTGVGTNKYVNGGVTNIVTNSGLSTSFITFDNSTNSSDLTVKWALALWGAGNGRIGFVNGGTVLTLNGNAVPEPSTNALLGLGMLGLIAVMRRKFV